MTDQTPAFEGWAIVELMGHRRLAGYVKGEEIAGHGMLRLDIPDPAQNDVYMATQYYNPSALYCLTPTTEAIARKVAAMNTPAPVQRWELDRPDRVLTDGESPDEIF